MTNNIHTSAEPDRPHSRATRVIKARYLTTGMTVLIGDAPFTVGTVHRYAEDTVLAYFDGVPSPTPYRVEEGIVVVDTQPAEVGAAPDVPRDWHFTFGAGQRFDGRYVTIHGTHESARAEMFSRFGNAWCAMYDATRPAEVTKFPTGLIELPRAQWPDPARPTILDLGEFGMPAAVLNTPATGGDILDRIGDDLGSAGYDLDVIALRWAGGHAVEVVDDGDGLLGMVTISQPEPDYWLSLADDLRQAAKQAAALAGTPTPQYNLGATLHLYSDYGTDGADRSVPIVDAIAKVFGASAETRAAGGRGATRLVGVNVGLVRVVARASMPNPPTRRESRAELEARVAELEAQLADRGTR